MTGHPSRRTRLRRLGLAAAALIVVAAGCGGDDDDASPEATAGGAATTEAGVATTEAGAATTEAGAATTEAAGTAPTTEESPTSAPPPAEDCPDDQNIPDLKVANSVPPASLSPLFGQGSGSGYNALIAVYGELMQFDPATGESVPSLAESLEPNEDLTEWTLTLRDGITFGSGNPFNTEAVKWNMEYLAAPDSTSASAAQAQRITSMEIVDDLEMKFTLAAPFADFPVMLGAPIGSIVDPAVAQAVGPDAMNAGQAPGAGAGPYEVDSWDRAVSVVLTRKDDYWGPKPCVEKYEEVFFADNQTRNDAFVNGEVDAIYLRGPIGHRLIREANPPDVDSYSQVVNNGSNLVINAGAQGVDRPGMDIRVRQAIGLALDPTVINERLLQGAGRPSKAFLDEDSAYSSSGIEPLAYDPDEATRLLDEAKADGYDGHLYFPTSNTADAVDQALIIEAQLEAVGFDVEVNSTFDGAGISQLLLTTNDYDIITSAMSAFDSDILGEINKRVTPWTGFESPEWTAAKDALGVAYGTEAKQEALTQISEVWDEQVPWVTLDHHDVSLYWHNDIEGFGFSKAGFITFDRVVPAGD